MKEPYPIYFHELTKEKQEELTRQGFKSVAVNIWAFEPSFKNRVVGVSQILQKAVGASNAGRTLSISPQLNSELLRLLSAVCYLFNSTSFREGEYFDFDQYEVNRKVGRK